MTGGEWRPSASLENLQLRARILAGIRAFFAERGVLEVETPLLSASGLTDPHIDSFSTDYTGPGVPGGCTLFLHTSPEFPMKRLLAAGSGPIYQVCRVFRQGEAGRRHNPEFTLLEWYRPGFDYHALMDEVEVLARQMLGEVAGSGPAERLTVAEAFLRHAGIDPHRADAEAFAACAREHDLPPLAGSADRETWRDLILTQLVEPRLGGDGLCFLHDYPADQAALARIRPGDPPVAERFELYCQGVELANGFRELADPAEQRARFERERAVRAASGMASVPLDERLLAALEAGLPDCSGVALGVDRLVMLAAGAESIEEVIAFPVDRA